jgi:acetolactate synthase I/III small subunit
VTQALQPPPKSSPELDANWLRELLVIQKNTKMRHVISLLIENEAGALSRVSGLFSARGYNIVEQITKQLNKLVEVVKVVDLSESAHIERELMLVKVRATGKDREEMKRMAEIFRGRIIDVTDASYVIELTGTQAKLDSFVGAIDSGLILETVRSGICGIGRGDRVLKV